jgi:hypothetical protein
MSIQQNFAERTDGSLILTDSTHAINHDCVGKEDEPSNSAPPQSTSSERTDGGYAKAAGMQEEEAVKVFSNLVYPYQLGRNLESLLAAVMKQALTTVNKTPSEKVIRLVESLSRPFLARRSEKEQWLEGKNFFQFARDVSRQITLLVAIEDAHGPDLCQKFVSYWLNRTFIRFAQSENFAGEVEFPSGIDSARKQQSLWGSWQRMALQRSISKGDLAFGASFHKGVKQGWPPLSEDEEGKHKKKHQERFESDHGIVPESLARTILATAKVVFDRISSPELYTKFCPSQAACLQANRQQGGATGIFTRLRTHEVSRTQRVQDHFVPLFHIRGAGELGFSRISDVGSKLHTPSIGMCDRVSLFQWRVSAFDTAFDSISSRISLERFGGLGNMQVIAFPEPGKYRVITKGDGYLFTALQPVQGAMISCWKNQPWASMRSSDLTEKVRLMHVSTHLPYFCSVDYEAATDLLKKDATLYAVQGLLESNPQFSDLILSAFLPGDLFYGSRKRGTRGFKEPITGIDAQPMGHPLSFPLLCVINLAVLVETLDQWENEEDSEFSGDKKDESRRVLATALVNGDDMLFRCTRKMFEIFRAVSASAGLKASAGKNYVSKTFAVINSQYYRVVHGQIQRFGYLNQRLLLGNNIKDESYCTPEMVSEGLNDMIGRTTWTRCSVPGTLARWKDFVNNFTPNWYLPVALGGYGINPEYAPSGWRITREQRKMAKYFFDNPQLSHFRLTTTTAEGDQIRKMKAPPRCTWSWEYGPNRTPYVGNFDLYLAGHGGRQRSEYETYESYVYYLMDLASFSAKHQKFLRDVETQVNIERRGFKEHRNLPCMSLAQIEDLRNRVTVTFDDKPSPPLLPMRDRRLEPRIKSRVIEQLWTYHDSASIHLRKLWQEHSLRERPKPFQTRFDGGLSLDGAGVVDHWKFVERGELEDFESWYRFC